MTPPSAFKYAERRPAPQLTTWIRNYWRLEVGKGAPDYHVVPPDGCTALVCRLGITGGPTTLLSGPWLIPLSVPVSEGDCYAGIRIQPGAVPATLGVDPVKLRNRADPSIGSEALFVLGVKSVLNNISSIEAVAERLDELFQQLSGSWQTPDPIVQTAVQRLTDSEGEIAIASLATELGVSPRTLRRRFGAATALAPKQFARIRRFLGAAWRVSQSDASWGRVAAESGFADQPHLNREMLDLTGLTPRAFKSRIRLTEHDDVRP